MHKTGNVLNYLPNIQAHRWRDALPKAQQGPARDLDGRDPRRSRARLRRLDRTLRGQVPAKATACLARDRQELLAFYFPGVHWTHLRTTNVIESSFATIRHRSKRAKGCVSRQSMLSMIYKVGMCAEKSWRRLRGFRQLGKVIEGVKLNDGIEVVEDSRAAA